MLAKIVVLFLIGMGVLAMFGRLRFPGQQSLRKLRAEKCAHCGRYLTGSGPCPCKKDT